MSSSNTLPAFDYASWSAQNIVWTPEPSSNQFHLDQFIGPYPDLDGATQTILRFDPYGSDGRSEWPTQWNTSAEPWLDPHSLNISTAFDSNTSGARSCAPDCDLISSDGAHFSVNAATLRENSLSDFGGFLASAQSTAIVSLSAKVLNLLLYAIHGLSVTRYKHSFADVAAAINALERYGLSKAALASHPGSPLYEVVFLQAPSLPLKYYSLAAHAGLDALAVAISPYTHSLTLPDITDEDALYMGPTYLKRLFFLHLGRVEALGRILRPPLRPHPPTEDCNGRTNQPIHGAWMRKAAEILWAARPNISAISLESRLSEVGKETDCPECLGYLNYRIQQILAEWSQIKNTI